MSDSIGPLRPIITGRPEPVQSGQKQGVKQQGDQNFGDLLRQTMAAQTTQTLTLSRHAMQRAEQREISLSDTDLERLDQAVDIARDKGLTDTLVLMDNTAFIVNVPNRMVVTMMEGGESDNRVITNIDGAVIV